MSKFVVNHQFPFQKNPLRSKDNHSIIPGAYHQISTPNGSHLKYTQKNRLPNPISTTAR